jgi:hypothetical protein
MTIVICIIGAVVGLVVGVVAGRFVLPSVLRSQAAHTRDGKVDVAGVPTQLRDPARLQSMTGTIYRFVIPLVFAVVGALGAYQLFVGDLR